MIFDLGIKVKRNVAQCPLYYVTYAATKFEVARSNGLGAIYLQETWRTHWQTTDRLRYEINIPFFKRKKRVQLVKAYHLIMNACTVTQFCKTCLKQPLEKKSKKWFSRPTISYYRSKVLQNATREHYVILSIFIKLPFVFKFCLFLSGHLGRFNCNMNCETKSPMHYTQG